MNSNELLTTYKAGGARTTPTINVGAGSPDGVAVDANGKIYVANRRSSRIATYTASGTETTPTIPGVLFATGVAVH